MTRAEKASDATLDEILASIRRIIAEEPSGARPLPVTKPKSPSLSAEPQRAGARPQTAGDEFGSQLSSLRPGAAPAPQTAAAPAQRPTAPDVSARQPRLDEPPMPELSLGGAPVARGPAAPAPLDSAFGRLADALGGNRRAVPETRPEVSLPPLARTAPDVVEAKPSPSPSPAAPFPAMRGAVDDLSDLLDDVAPPPPSPTSPVSAEVAAAPAPVFAMPPDVIAPPADAMRRDAAAPRTIARRTVDLGAIVPGRDEPVADAAIVGETPVETPAEPVATGAGSRSSAQSRAMDKMLSARIASASVKHPAPPPEPSGPVVIASMPDPAVSELDVAAEDEIANPGEDAASALDMLAAGLAQAAPTVPAERAQADASSATAAPEPRVPEATKLPEPPLPVAPAAAANPAPSRPVVSSAAPSLPFAAAPSAATAVPPPAATPPAAPAVAPVAAPAASAPPAVGAQVPATLPPVVGVRTIEDMVAELLRPMLREWLAENMPRMVEKALRIELAEGLKTVNHEPRKVADK
ncbi:MAG: DUF2497 domain-containing protein [Hyphomicrobiaceae bacterium]|nr:DUF2497 domain-containing protein [Hyphomicrobiaceae bacterium]